MFSKGGVLSGFLDYNNKLEAHRSKYHLYTKQMNSSMMFAVMDKVIWIEGCSCCFKTDFWILLMKTFLVEISIWFICAHKSDFNPPKIAVRCYEMDEVSDYRKKMKDKVLGSLSSCFKQVYHMFLKLLTLDLTPAVPQLLSQVTLADSYSVDFPWLLSWGNWIVLLDFLPL